MNRRDAIQKVSTLLGFAISAPAILAINSGCKAESYIEKEFTSFSESQSLLIGEIAETILPKSGTPGAKDVKVPEFIQLALQECYPNKIMQLVAKGLDSVEQSAMRKFNNEFVACQPDERKEIVRQLESDCAKAVSKNKPHFYRTIKELTLLGFFSSEEVMVTMLDYHPVAGKYDGCIPIQDDQKLFVDNNV